MPQLPLVAGYTLVDRIGGGGFSTVYRAVLFSSSSSTASTNISNSRVLACKHIAITPSTTSIERKRVEKEMKIHLALKNAYILEFINASIVEPGKGQKYWPGFYLLLEMAAGGDLFDKIGNYVPFIVECTLIDDMTVPNKGIDEEVAQYFFNQLVSGIVGLSPRSFASSDCIYRCTCMKKAYATGISNLKTSYLTLLVPSRYQISDSALFISSKIREKQDY